MAIVLKFFSGVLPHPFQYIGLFYVLSLFLNFWFGRLIAKQMGYRAIAANLIGCFFVLSPIVPWRLHGHSALTAQWLLLASLYFYLYRSRSLASLIPHAVTCVLAATIHAYFVPMVAVLAVAAAGRLVLERKAGIVQAVGAVLGIGVAVMLVLFVIGTIGTGVLDGADEYGYRTFSTNLLALFNPQGWGGLLWGALPDAMPDGGYEYLGLGMLALLVVSIPGIIGAIRQTPASSTVPLLVACLLLAIMAVSATVALGPWIIATIPLPASIERLMSIFRVSDRFFWPVYYVILIAVFRGVRELPPRVAMVALPLALAVQIADIRPMFRTIGIAVTRVNDIPDDITAIRPQLAGYSHLMVLPMWRCNYAETPLQNNGYRYFGFLAADLNMATNDYDPSRWTKEAIAYHCEQAPQDFISGKWEPSTAYVVSDKLLAKLPAETASKSCRRVASLNLCVTDK